MVDQLALLGGTPVIQVAFPPYNSLGEEEACAAAEVVRSGCLSAYLGSKGPGFMGGAQVRSLEQEAAEFFGTKHCLAVNSWTSGLIASVGAIALDPGDEVITSPWTMSATATSILHWNAIPVFADIDEKTFNLSPSAVEGCITPRTRAIMAPDIFGQSCDIEALSSLARKHGLFLISDSAQSPGALTAGGLAGTLSDIGGFSLNYHKHIHCGEGGLAVTNDDSLADRISLIRNHGEVLLGQGASPKPRFGILGYNFRMGEIEAAIARIQLTKLPYLVSTRQRAAEQLVEGLASLPGLATPFTHPANSHVYYGFALTLNPDLLGVSRDTIFRALVAEGVPGLGAGYQLLHKSPLFAEGLAYGKEGYPYSLRAELPPANCVVAEELHATTLVMGLCTHDFDRQEVNQVLEAFHRVWSNLDSLRSIE